MFAIAGKEKSYEAVGCKVYQVGLTSIVLEFGHDFKIIGLMSVLLCFFQKFFFNDLDIKNISPNILVVLAVEA